MAGRVTIQDIADALGLSRNTVSKAINNTGVLADATREKILKKAVDMGYKQFSYVNVQGSGAANLSLSDDARTAPPAGGGVISLLTRNILDSSHFASAMLDKFQYELSWLGYSFMSHRVTDEDIQKGRLPASVNLELTAGFLCIELFDMPYAEMLCELGVPTLFVDAPAASLTKKLASDILIMDNRTSVISFIADMAARGYTKFGYVGEVHHCRSFYERYLAMQEGLLLAGLPYSDRYCVTGSVSGKDYPDTSDYRTYFEQQIRAMKELPDVFLCANDFVAIDVLAAFSKLGISVPDDVLLCGFDDSPESRVMTPALSTIHIHSQIMGFSAVHLLLSRIREPSLNFRTLVTETTLIKRASTRDE